MTDVPLDDCALLLRGALGAETGEGITPVRLPLWACAQAPSGFTQDVFRMASGVRLAFATDASTVELDVAAAGFGVAGANDPGLGRPLICDLLIEGQEVDQRTIKGSTRIYGEGGRELVDSTPRVVSTVRFEGLPSTRKDIELWLPQNAIVEVVGLRANAAVVASDETRPRWIHYGSSISHCMEAHSPTKTWPAISARLGGFDLLNLGFGGNCHLDPFVARTIRDLPADFISLKAGINIAGDSTFKERSFIPAVHGFIDTIRDGHPDTPILVVSPIIAPLVEGESAKIKLDASDGGLTLPLIREILSEIVEARAAADPNLRYLDGLLLLGEGDVGNLPDGAHPNAEGYVTIGERFAAQVFAEPAMTGV